MEEKKRIRVVFKDDDVLSDTQKSEGLNRSWLLLKQPYQLTISDLASHLLNAFNLHHSCPNGLVLSVDGFVLPPFESSSILKENEIIRVRRRRNILSVEGNNAVEKLEAVKHQPVNSGGVLLLANEEFDKEKGGYESDEESEEEDEEEELLLGTGNDDAKNRKRKAPEKLLVSKKKKQRSEAPGDDVRMGEVGNSSRVEDLTKKKLLSKKDKNTVPGAEDNGENAKLDENDVSQPDMKRKAKVQENGKETEDAKTASKETKKVPSRSARRKYAKRRWLKEMAKIQKTARESESFRNWKEDHAKTEKSKSVQLKGQQNWKKPRVDAEKSEVEGQPKGLLHWKQSPRNNLHIKGKKHQQRNQNAYFHKHQNLNGNIADERNQKGDRDERSYQNDDMLVQPNKIIGAHEQPNQRNDAPQQPIQNENASTQPNEEADDEENEVVPIVIKPGHIRFEPLGKEQAVQQNHMPLWNGITSKKKGQKWGKENSSFTLRYEYKTSNEDNPEVLSSEKEKQPVGGIDFDKLPPLPSTPKEGDIIAYRVLELSSSWTPVLSAYRVGKVSWYNANSRKTKLLPVSGYPIVFNAGEDEDAQPDTSLYKEDGSLEIDFSTLLHVRLLSNENSEPRNEPSSCVSEDHVSKENTPKTIIPSSNDEQTLVPGPVVETAESNLEKETEPPTAENENSGTNLWDQFTEALNAKKEQLTKESSWGKTPPKKVQVPQQDNNGGRGKNGKNVQPSSVNSWGKNAKVVRPPSSVNSWGKNAKVVRLPSQENSWEKESSGSKSLPSKGAQGSELGSTMDILRSIYRDGY